ncbi:MAG: hypothetical protein Q9172_005658 [Xanthocarpia lactea]
MAEPSIYDEIELEDLTYHSSTTLYTYPCPCGDQFEITLQDLRDGEDIALWGEKINLTQRIVDLSKR